MNLREHASQCGITSPQWHNSLVAGPGEKQGHSLFCPFPVRGSICLRCGFDAHSLLKNWNKRSRGIYWKKPRKGEWVFLASLFSSAGTPTYICPSFSWDILKGNKKREPWLWVNLHTHQAPKVLPNYRFLSQGHSGMRSKMDYAPTLALILTLFFFLLFLTSLPCSSSLPLLPLYFVHSPSLSLSPFLFNGLHMSAG